jgi:hypothetical protein
VIWSPTRVCSIVGRFGCDGERDFPNVRILQQQLSLTAYDRRGAAAAGVPAPDAAVPDELALYEQLRVWMQAFPPAAPERTYQQRVNVECSFAVCFNASPGPSDSSRGSPSGCSIGSRASSWESSRSVLVCLA